MSEVTLSSTTLIELGLATQEPPKEEVLLGRDHLKSNLPAIPDHVPGANRLIADLIDLAAILDSDPDREAARDRMRKRLVRQENGRGVHYAPIEFEAEMHGEDAHAVAWYDNLPGSTKRIKIVPLIYAGPEFLKPIGNNKYITGGTFQCILFRPLTKNGAYKALPLGLADPKTIRTWNDIVTRHNNLPAFKDEQWNLIEIIEHELRRPGVRRVRFIPRFDLHAELKTGHTKRQLLGCHFGQKVFLAPKAIAPEPDCVDGVRGFFEQHLFRVKRLNENSIEVVWHGSAKDVKIEDRIFVEEIQHEMNPFIVLNTTPSTVDWKTVDQSTRKWLNRAYDEKNPLYLAGLELSLVKETDDLALKRAHLEQLWKEAVRLIRLEMIHAADIGRKQLSIAPGKPSWLSIMGTEKNIETVLLYPNEPEDAAAIWISRVLDRPFDSKSPYLMHLRAWLINSQKPTSLTTSLPPPIPAKLQPPIEVPELTTVSNTTQAPQPPPIRTREPSRPSFQVDTTFAPDTTDRLEPEDIEIEIFDALEEVHESETTSVDFEPNKELMHLDTNDPIGSNEGSRSKFFAKPGSILHMGSMGIYTDK
jgi:hypothetical protein